jgi:HEPN domain-containing protein
MTDPVKYIETARDYQTAVQILCQNLEKNTLIPTGVLASQAIELSLKAYLLNEGKNEKDLKDISHDLSRALDETVKLGLKIDRDVTFTVDVLSLSHNWPNLFRYPKKGEAVGIMEPEVLCEHLESIIAEVEKCFHE